MEDRLLTIAAETAGELIRDAERRGFERGWIEAREAAAKETHYYSLRVLAARLYCQQISTMIRALPIPETPRAREEG